MTRKKGTHDYKKVPSDYIDTKFMNSQLHVKDTDGRTEQNTTVQT